MKIKYKSLLIISLYIIVITIVRLVWLSFQIPIDQPRVVKGIMDMRGWQLPANKTINLNGEWEFLPNQMLAREIDVIPQFPRDTPNYIHVPGDWKASFPSKPDHSFYYGTYRLRILTDDDSLGLRAYGLRINEIRNASAVYVDGHLLAGRGQPADTLEQYTAKRLPYSTHFTPEGNEIEIIIQASNHAGKGGITQSISFGDHDTIDKSTLFTMSLQFMLGIVLLVHGLYALILYLLGAANKGMLYFSLLIFCAIISVITADDRLLLQWVPFPYEWFVKVSLLSYVGFASFLPPLFKHLFPGPSQAKSIYGYAIYCAVYALFILLAPSAYTLATANIFLTAVLFLSVFISIRLLQKALREKEDVIFLLIAAISITVNIVWTSIENRTGYEMKHYPFDLMAACFAFAAFWFKRFFRVNTQTKELAERLQLADKHKDDFLANTSHELRNPLHGIINIAQTVMDNKLNPPHESSQRSLQTLITVGRRMTHMLDDLLDVTRLKEGTVRLQVKKLRLQSVIGGVFEMLRFMTEGKPIRFHMDIDDSFPAVMADENRLIQILFNLVHNAVKFTDEGDITVRASAQNGMASIHVVDTGIGIEEEVQRRIFQPYEQGTSNMTRAGGGFGLGLSICRQLVELHGGTLRVDSTPGMGSVFTFTLPTSFDFSPSEEVTDSHLHHIPTLTTDAVMELSPTRPVGKTAYKQNRAKILAVDDDVVNLKILEDILDVAQYEITTVTSGSEAIAKLDSNHYDLIITDVMMPQMSGYELTRQIRERFSISELPVLLITARNRSEDIYTGFHSGANDYVTKPVDALELRSRVLALTDLKESIGERLRMEAAWLQAQIQPHFLFNTLNSIAALSKIDISEMQDLLDVFSTYLRTSFDFHNSDHVVSIERELELVRAYLFIEKQRFEERLQIQWEVDANLHFLLPPLSIQTLVENAVRHGLLQRSRGGTIRIRITGMAGYVEISIIDDGVGIKEEKLQLVLGKQSNAGIGLRNTDRRLKQMYGKGLHIESAPGQGTVVTFRVPKKA
jgi:two-component system sensor histidine kinase ChiS